MHRTRLIACAACLSLGLVDLVYLDAWALPPLLRGDAGARPSGLATSVKNERAATTAGAPPAPPTVATRAASASAPKLALRDKAPPSPPPSVAAPETSAPKLALRDKAPPPPSPPPSVAAPETSAPVRAEAKAGALVVVTFNTARATLSNRFAAAIDRAARRIEQGSDAIRVEGHADARGDEAFNQELSERRAGAVADRLRELGVAAERLTVTGFGSRRPVVAGNEPEAYARNRRVEIWVGRHPVVEEKR